MAILELRDVKKEYKVGDDIFPVLKGISLKFERGNFVSILGESGTGKSTLLNIIAGLDNQYGGDVLLNGDKLKSSSEKKLDEYHNKTIGFIFQSFNLIRHLTNLENVLVPLGMTTLTKSERVQRAKQLLHQVGLGDHINKYPNQLSGGQKQRVAIARALSTDPDIIIADEPTGALDSKNTKEILEMLQTIAENGKLVIQVTHSRQAAEYGTRIVHMVDGTIDYDQQIMDGSEEQNDVSIQNRNLSLASSIKMAWQHIKYNWKRNLLIVFGGSIGIFSVILMLGIGSGIQAYMNNQINSKVNPRTILVTQAKASAGKQPVMKIADEHSLNRLKHINSVQKGYFTTNTVVQYRKKQTQLSLLETFNRTQLKSDLKYGSNPKEKQILLDQGAAFKLKSATKDLIGKMVQVYVPALGEDNKPIQIPLKVRVSGVTTSATSSISYKTLESAFKNSKALLNPNFMALNVDKIKNVKAVENKIKLIKTGNHHDYKITGAGALVDTLNNYILLAFYLLAGIAGISLLVSAIMIIVVLYISVSERTKEIGILRAMGARRKDVRRLFVSEASFIGLFSGLLGLRISATFAKVINYVANSHIHSNIVALLPAYMVFGVLVSIVISLFAALAPSSAAAKLNVVDALSVE